MPVSKFAFQDGSIRRPIACLAYVAIAIRLSAKKLEIRMDNGPENLIFDTGETSFLLRYRVCQIGTARNRMIATLQEVALNPMSTLLLPPRPLANCLFAAIFRDTRGADLGDAERLNHFPASPLYSITCVIEGDLRIVEQVRGIEMARVTPLMPRLWVTPPQETPVTSWSPGPILAISLGIYPDAWAKLAAQYGEQHIAGMFEHAFGEADCSHARKACWAQFCGTLAPLWHAVRGDSDFPERNRVARLADWSRELLVRAAMAGPGRSLRSIERRLKRWSGQTRQSLDFYAAFESLHQLSVQTEETPLAALASEAGYADQSHMGRAIRRATGFSPAQLNRRIESEEAFWCYRLLGERF